MRRPCDGESNLRTVDAITHLRGIWACVWPRNKECAYGVGCPAQKICTFYAATAFALTRPRGNPRKLGALAPFINIHVTTPRIYRIWVSALPPIRPMPAQKVPRSSSLSRLWRHCLETVRTNHASDARRAQVASQYFSGIRPRTVDATPSLAGRSASRLSTFRRRSRILTLYGDPRTGGPMRPGLTRTVAAKSPRKKQGLCACAFRKLSWPRRHEGKRPP